MLLAKTPSECCLFNACNNHTVFLDDIISKLKEKGKNIRFVEQEEFNEALLKAGEDPEKAVIVSSFLAYLHTGEDSQLRPVGVDCTYTNEVLCRMDFLWNVTDMAYIDRFLTVLEGFMFFDETNLKR